MSLIAQKVASVVLEMAAEKIGGKKQLADRLGVPVRALGEYIDGTAPVSEDLYLKAVDIVLGG